MEPAIKSYSFSDIKVLIEKIHEVADQFHIVSLNHQIDICKTLLIKSPLIDVAILGQFKAGKSSFINSLVEKDILPVGVIPVTTVITRLQYGKREQAIITYFDGTRSEIDLVELGDFISEAQNSANAKNVDIVDIELPSLKGYPGIRLVDTPGMGSVFKYHREVAENWLPEVGAAILAISADRPLSEHDLTLIEDLSHHTPRIILLLTKADLLTPDQQMEVLQFFQKTLKQKLDREFPLFLYSIRSNTEIFKQRIDAGLLSGLSRNHDREFERIVHHKTQSLLKRCLSYLNVAMKTSLEADKDRETLRNLILNEKVSYDQIIEEIALIARENQRQTRIMLMKYLERFQKPLSDKLTKELAGELPAWKGNLWRLSRRYEEWLTDTMEGEIRHISKTENKHFYGTLNKAHASLTRYLESFKMLLDDNIQKVLGIKLAETDWSIEVVEPEYPDIKVLFAFDIHLDLIWFLIPMVIFRGLFEKHFLKGIPWAVEINLSRLAAQWEARINKAIDEMRKQANQYIKEEISTIDALLSKTHGRTNEIRELILELQEQLQIIDMRYFSLKGMEPLR
jgi:GTP-binding protein EngB required for normal cell division